MTELIRSNIKAAQKNNRLVIFAGAGVSYAKPAGLPTFESALERTWEHFYSKVKYARHFNEFRDRTDYADKFQFLYDICRDPVKIFVKGIYSNAQKPSILHKSLVRLFKPDQSLRIITTNYDNLMTIAAKDYLRSEPREYKYPSLILNDGSSPKQLEDAEANFNPTPYTAYNGISYIHGSVDGYAEDLVMTKQDFKDAYLGPNTVTPFVHKILDNGTALFIGYSLNDPITPDFISTCSKHCKTYALCTEKESDKWYESKATPIVYQVDDNRDEHFKMISTLCRWADEVQNSKLLQDELEKLY